MNILKHMEAAFIALALAALPASYLADAIPDAQARAADAAVAVATPGKMAVVTVSAKRLSADEKRAEAGSRMLAAR